MPKKRRSFVSPVEATPTATAETVTAAVESQVASKIEDFAEDLGRLLGTARTKAEGWLGQRTQIADDLVQIRDTAQGLLSDLGVGSAPEAQRRAVLARRGPGRPPKAARKQKRTMSPEARERIAAAQRARWAKQKAGR